MTMSVPPPTDNAAAAAAAARGRAFREWVFLVLALLLMAALWATERYTAYHQTGVHERDRLFAQARSVDDSLQRQLQRLDKLLAVVADEPVPAAEAAGDSSRRLRRYLSLSPGLRELLRLDAQGRVIEASQPERVGTSLADSAAFKRTIERAPSRIAKYGLDAASVFHSFYNECRVISDDTALTVARLALVDAAKTVIANALNIMGIAAPERM